ncbi:MAG: hypothetical protein HFG63_14600 [Lachnospiraceae bacterium]|nr:hypothetical protein [Lachnospiraceae bacterium]
MSKLKTSSTSSQPAAGAEKDLQLVRQQAEMKAGEALIREVSRKTQQQREQAQSDRKDSDTGPDQPKDTAELSGTHAHPRPDQTGSAEEIPQWVLEMAGKDWEAFLEWWPDPDLPLADQLKELSKLYLSLLEAALKYAEGENLAEQLQRLDSLLAQKLELVMDHRLDQIMNLLEETKDSAAQNGIRSSLYRQTAGRTLTPQAVHSLFAQAPPGRNAAGSSAAFRSASSSFSGEGMIYQSSGKQNIRFQQVYQTQQHSWKEQLRQRTETIRDARNGVAGNSFGKAGSLSCSPRELEAANRFAAHIRGTGNLFRNPDITARNEEVTGLLAAVMTIKGQVYAGETARTGSLAQILQNTIGKIVSQYLGRKGAASVYNHTLTAYRQTGNPQKAIQEGQDYAFRQFREKQKNPAFQKSVHYSRESGFFRSFLKNLSPEKELALGSSVLQEDWKKFLHTMGNPQTFSYLSRAAGHSPWGFLAGPGAQSADSSGHTAKILLGTGVLIFLGLLAGVWLRLF